MPPSPLDRERLERLIEVGRGLLVELDLDEVFDRVLGIARELTGAKYAALGVLDEDRRQLAEFHTRGIDEETHQAIGDLPRGRGILGVLIDDPRPLRLDDVGAHPKSYGFPPSHPPMNTFLGVPILVRGEVWGNLYLTEKAGGEGFDAADEASVVVLADWAAITIEHARLYRSADARRRELERAVRGFEATAAIARAVGGETDLNRVLELIVKRGRALIEARSVLVFLREGDELRVAARAGERAPAAHGLVAIADPLVKESLERQRPLRLHKAKHDLSGPAADFGFPDASSALVAPLVYRGQAVGLLVAFDRLSGDASFTRDDEQVLDAFAASAATAVATAQTVQAERLRHSLEASESERRRWARELHDETLQALGGLRVLLAGAARSDDAERKQAALEAAVDQLSQDVTNLRAIIADLRPAALDDLGLEPALDGLLERLAVNHGWELRSELDLGPRRLTPALETVVYRLVQEALTNVAKHANADTVQVHVVPDGKRLEIRIADDGAGFDTHAQLPGFGLLGMRERVALSGGDMIVRDHEGTGTEVLAILPLLYDENGGVDDP